MDIQAVIELARDLERQTMRVEQLEADQVRSREPAVTVKSMGAFDVLIREGVQSGVQQRVFIDDSDIALEWTKENGERTYHMMGIKRSQPFAVAAQGSSKLDPSRVYNLLTEYFRDYIKEDVLALFKRVTSKTLRASENTVATGVSREFSATVEGTGGTQLPKRITLYSLPVIDPRLCFGFENGSRTIDVPIADIDLWVYLEDDGSKIVLKPNADILEKEWFSAVIAFTRPLRDICHAQGVDVIDGYIQDAYDED